MQSINLNLCCCVVLAGACSRDAQPNHPRPDPARDSAHATALAVQPPAQPAGTLLVDPGTPESPAVGEAIAVLEPTRGHAARGTVRFRETTSGLEVFASIDNLPAGAHAYHVHLFGDCSAADAKSAGPHFHFHGSSHDKTVPMITGNLGDLTATSPEAATHRTTVKASLHGPFSIVGRAVVVHEKANDHNVTPDGGAGARLACGVIGIAQVPNLDQQPTTAENP